MSEPAFSLKEVLDEGWQLTKEYFWKFWLVTLVAGSVLFSLSSLAESIGDGPMTWVIGLIAVVVGGVLDLGFVSIMLRWQAGERAGLEDLLSQYRLIFGYVLASIPYEVCIAGLFMLVRVSGGLAYLPSSITLPLLAIAILFIYFAIRLHFYVYSMVHKQLGAIASLKESMRITRGSFSLLLLLWIMLFVMNTAGFLLLRVGLLLTIPCSVFTIVSVYRKLLKAADNNDKEPEKVAAPLEPISEAPAVA